MSDESNIPDDDDDGWGAAADQAASAEETETEPANAAADWDDPANLRERVAALRTSAEQPAVSPPETGEGGASEDEDQEGGAEEPENTSEDDAPVRALVPKERVTEEWGAASEEEDSGDEARPDAAKVVDDEDAPQWASPPTATDPRTTQSIAAPSSDMLAAASAVAKKTSDPKKRDRAEVRGGLSRKQLVRLIAVGAALVIAGVVAILGWLNSQNYYLVCGTKAIRAEQGRFWPTGQNALPGRAFAPIQVPSNALCQSTSFSSRKALEVAFLDALLEQSTLLLTKGGAEQVATAEAQLEQALLLTRSPDRASQRELAERLVGDVSYWRGAADVKRAVEALKVGAESFAEAAAKRPRHSSDASAWAEHARFIAEEIEKGPRSLRADEAPKEEPHFGGLSEPMAPQPVPSREDAGAEVPEPATEEVLDAGVPTAPPSDADVPPPDAALPQGGVLL